LLIYSFVCSTSFTAPRVMKRRVRGRRALARLRKAIAAERSSGAVAAEARAPTRVSRSAANDASTPEAAAAALRTKVAVILRDGRGAAEEGGAIDPHAITPQNAARLSECFAFSASEESDDAVTADFADPTLSVALVANAHAACIVALRKAANALKKVRPVSGRTKAALGAAQDKLKYWKARDRLVTDASLAELRTRGGVVTLGQLLALDAYGLREIVQLGVAGIDIAVLHALALLRWGGDARYMSIATRYMSVVKRGRSEMHRMFTTVFKPERYPRFVTRVQSGWSPGVLDLSKPQHLKRDREIHNLNGAASSSLPLGAAHEDVNSSSSEDDQIEFPPTRPVFSHTFEAVVPKPARGDGASLGVTIRIHKNAAVRLSGIGATGGAPDAKIFRIDDEILCVDRMRLRRGHFFEKLVRTAFFIRDRRGEMHMRMRRRERLVPTRAAAAAAPAAARAVAAPGPADASSDEEDDLRRTMEAEECADVDVDISAVASFDIPVEKCSPTAASAGAVAAGAMEVDAAQAGASAIDQPRAVEPYSNMLGARLREESDADGDFDAMGGDACPPIGHGGLNYSSILSPTYTGWIPNEHDNIIDGSELWPKASLGTPCPCVGASSVVRARARALSLSLFRLCAVLRNVRPSTLAARSVAHTAPPCSRSRSSVRPVLPTPRHRRTQVGAAERAVSAQESAAARIRSQPLPRARGASRGRLRRHAARDRPEGVDHD
jgi:hypothetical protein